MQSILESQEDYSHSQYITQFIDDCLKEANLELSDLDAVALSAGPGSFTGLRVGSATAKGICYALDLPLIAVSTLLSLASEFESENYDLILPMIDARRMEVYTRFVDSKMDTLKEDFSQILDDNFIAEKLADFDNILCCGNGSFKMAQLELPERIKVTKSACSVRNMLKLGVQLFESQEFVDLSYFEPYYLKPANITKPKSLL